MLLLPLALTSTWGAIRRLGGKRWQALHRLIYISAAAGVIHCYWPVRSDIRMPLRYGVILEVLMLYRGVRAVARPAPAAKSAAAR